MEQATARQLELVLARAQWLIARGWCQGAVARNCTGVAVEADDDTAMQWSLEAPSQQGG